MKRREFFTLAAAAAVFPRVAFAQQAKVPRIAFVAPPVNPAWIDVFRQGLADYGYVVGKTITLDFFTAPTTADLAAFALKAVASKPDVIVMIGGFTSVVASVPTTIPIVFGAAADPLSNGLVSSLAHPGGNVTGTTVEAPDLASKQLAIMKEIIPTMTRIAALRQPVFSQAIFENLQVAATVMRIEPVIVDFVDGQDFTTQLDRILAAKAQAIYVPASTYFPNYSNELADFQIEHGLPLVTPGVSNLRALVGYGPSAPAMIRKTGAYIDAILRGAKPADLPVEQQTVFDLSINLTTAKAMSITIPPSVLAQATIVRE